MKLFFLKSSNHHYYKELILSPGSVTCLPRYAQDKTAYNAQLAYFVWFATLHPSQQFSVMSGQVFLGWTSTKQRLMCLAQGHNAVTLVRLEPSTPQSRVKNSTTEPKCSLTSVFNLDLSWFCFSILTTGCLSFMSLDTVYKIRSFKKSVERICMSFKTYINPYKPSVLFVGNGQAVQIRRRRMRRLIRVSTVCSQNVLSKFE